MESGDVVITGANFATHLRRIIAFVVDETNISDRVAAYKELNMLFRLRDTEESVFNVQTNLSILLRLIEDDLNKSASEVRQWAMRTVSYLMFHDALVECFSHDQIERWVAALAQLTDTARSEKAFKLSVWCLAIQNLRLSRADVLRVTQVLARALMNQFCTNSVALLILKAFHSMMLKFPDSMCMVNCIQEWFPAAVQHSQSRHSDIRTTSHTLLLDVQRHFEGMDVEKRVFIEKKTIQLFMPMLYSLVEDDRLRIALILWPVALKLLRTKLREDAALLNAMLYIPEKALLHLDSSIRSFGMEIWKNLVDVFREAQVEKAIKAYPKSEWIFRRPLNRLLLRPISACWEQEKCMDVLTCSMTTWRYILTATLADYNAFCIAQERSFACVQKFASTHLSRWYNEIVTKPLIQQMSAATFEIQGLLEIVTSIWQVHDRAAGTAGNQSSDTSDTHHTLLLADPIAISFILFDVLSFLEMLIRLEGKSSEVLHAIDQVWVGVCSRLAPCQKEGYSAGAFDSKLVARMTRVCLHFGFGISGKRSKEFDLEAVVYAWNNSTKRKIALLYEICTRIFIDTFVSTVVHPQSTISGFLQRYVTVHSPSTCINDSQRARLRALLQCGSCLKLSAMANMIVFLALLAEINASDDESFAMCRRLGLQYAHAFPGFDAQQAFSRSSMQRVQPGHAIMSKMDQIADGNRQASKQVSELITPLRPSNRSRNPTPRRRDSLASSQSDRPNRWVVRHPSAVIRSLFSAYEHKPIGGMARVKAQEAGWIDPNQTACLAMKESRGRTGPTSSPNRSFVTTSTSISPAVTGPRTQTSKRKRVIQYRNNLHRKRVCRSLNEWSHTHPGDGTPKLADRVTIQLPGLLQVKRPGQDSQSEDDQSVVTISDSMQKAI
uniref:Uncharacterized protein AlNc14C10G1296 n=1 Tax=Albugo laibachii Nc14 TaxID=890382 RepID=F0W2Q8_9STRA|nr:conserved hypothetical protein [Albugo laibachii Nc14]|eukprot:CCA15344.1 conserved hypothetical protein [Albugo laibachii Nc14]